MFIFVNDDTNPTMVMKKMSVPRLLGLLLFSACFWAQPLAAQEASEAEPYPYNATGEMVRRTDSAELIYRFDLHFHRPVKEVVGSLAVFDARDTLEPLVVFGIKQLADLGAEEKQIAFVLPAAKDRRPFSRKATLSYNKWDRVFSIAPVYRPHPGKMDDYLDISAFQFRFKADLRTVEAEWVQNGAAEEAAAGADGSTQAVDSSVYYDALAGGMPASLAEAVARGEEVSRWEIMWAVLKDTEIPAKSVVLFVVKSVLWLAVLFFFILMLPKARKARQVPALGGAAVCFLCVSFDNFYPFLPALPGFLLAYPRLYSQAYPYAYLRTKRLFTWCTVGMTVLLSVVCYQLWGREAIGEIVGWVIASAVAWYGFSWHLGKSCCRCCGAYGRHKKLSEELIKRDIKLTRIHDDAFSHTEVTPDEVIDWYERRYGMRVDIWETYDVYYECMFCGKIFKNQEDKHKSSERW